MGRTLVCMMTGEREDVCRAVSEGAYGGVMISRSDAIELARARMVEWIKEPKNSWDRGVIRLLKKGRPFGLSCQVGEYLALAVREKRPWAELMLSEIRRAHAA